MVLLTNKGVYGLLSSRPGNEDLRARLEALEQAAGIDGSSGQPMSSGLSDLWLLLGSLALGGLVLGGMVTTVRWHA